MSDASPAPLTPEELRELVELEKKAMRAPWIHQRQVIYSAHGRAPFVAQTHPDLRRFPSKADDEYAEGNSALIVALRNAAPRLFSELLALREENERLSEALADTDHTARCKFRTQFDSDPCSCGKQANAVQTRIVPATAREEREA